MDQRSGQQSWMVPHLGIGRNPPNRSKVCNEGGLFQCTGLGDPVFHLPDRYRGTTRDSGS